MVERRPARGGRWVVRRAGRGCARPLEVGADEEEFGVDGDDGELRWREGGIEAEGARCVRERVVCGWAESGWMDGWMAGTE